ncbi:MULTISPECIES: hypothetical protein [Bacillaceae]|uniref:DUF4367 domain-containing protein n=1 Tax=Evansella alkalicola TaxID=745819 RepID=A0ABS6JYN1_9BACI|nr:MULTISPECIES: hypothetical protein [Bacillaceae]MBU9722205.1 hypothetical protein [Bacillus alkalicola]
MKRSEQNHSLEKSFISMEKKVQLQQTKKEEILQQINTKLDAEYEASNANNKSVNGGNDGGADQYQSKKPSYKYYGALAVAATLVLLLFLPWIGDFLNQATSDRLNTGHPDHLYEAVRENVPYPVHIPYIEGHTVVTANYYEGGLLTFSYMPNDLMTPDMKSAAVSGEKMEIPDDYYTEPFYGPYDGSAYYYRTEVMISPDGPFEYLTQPVTPSNAKKMTSNGVEISYYFSDAHTSKGHFLAIIFHLESNGVFYRPYIEVDRLLTDEEVQEKIHELVPAFLID